MKKYHWVLSVAFSCSCVGESLVPTPDGGSDGAAFSRDGGKGHHIGHIQRDASVTDDMASPTADMASPTADMASAPRDMASARDLASPPGDPNLPSCANPGPGTAPNGTIPGTLSFPSPTLRNLTVVWNISGDDNLNGVVQTFYRKTGESGWHPAMPLRRTPAGTLLGFSWPNRHSGSIFDLDPDTSYDVAVSLNDPDGGCEVRTATVRTRPIPAPMAGAPIKAVTPATFATVAGGAQPGDILELGAGTYPSFTFDKDGAAGKPIVIRANGAVTVTGDVTLAGRQHVQLVGLIVQGTIRIGGTLDVVVMKNKVNTTSDGIITNTRGENDYIADNVVTGATTWGEASLGVNGTSIGEGILVTGPGHVVEHNRVSAFQDCLSLYEESEAVDQYSIDFVENDVDTCGDDGIEADFCFHDCRIVRNRFTNVFMGMSSQPGLGGPTYFIRNAAYNVVLSAFKLQRASIGDVLLHNTIVKNGDAFGIYDDVVFDRQYVRNNLFLGGPGGTYNGYSNNNGHVIELRAAGPSGSYDYDAYGFTTGAFSGKLGANTFTDLATLHSNTTEKHAIQVDYSIFAAPVAYPTSPFPRLAVPDMRPKAGLEQGVPLPNINSGTSPTIGAYDVGQPLPAYGPR
jgi:hypothetical protein